MELNNSISEKYNIKVHDIERLTDKSYKIVCDTRNCYFIKQVPKIVESKYIFLSNQGVNNVLYPILNNDRKYITDFNDKNFYVNDYIENIVSKEESRAYNMFNALDRLHSSTTIKKQLSTTKSRPKIEEITKQLDYKFVLIEQYIRGLETKPIDKDSMLVLEKYHIILNAKKELVTLQKKIILSIKDKNSVEYSFVHNNPKNDHLIMKNGYQYLTSITNGKIGVSSLDMAKFYIENSELNLDYKEIIFKDYYSQKNNFYYDYFRFLVLFIYIKSIHFLQNDIFNKEQFVRICIKIEKFMTDFSQESN
jgi:hypothetical protein